MGTDPQRTVGNRRSEGGVRSPQDMAAGLFLIALAAVGFFGSWSLKMGQLTGIGPGMLPKVVAIMIAAFGLLLVVGSLTSAGAHLSRWNLRGLALVLGAAVLFALLIRVVGLVVAGPLAVLIASLADPENKPLPSAIFGIVMTMFCGLLFKEMLNLPIPFDPMSLIWPLHGPYAAFKGILKSAVLALFVRG